MPPLPGQALLRTMAQVQFGLEREGRYGVSHRSAYLVCPLREDATRLTGPKRPQGTSGESALYAFQAVKVYLVVASGCRSPMMRLTQALMTLTEISLAPGFSA